MKDQAAELRRLTVRRAAPFVPVSRGTSAVVIGSGKGGVGKSVIAALLAAALARAGHRVLLFDGAQHQGNLHLLLGTPPAAGLDGALSGTVAPADLVTLIGDGLALLPAESGAEAVYGLPPVDRARLHHRLTAIYDDYDTVVVDTGQGIDGVVRCVFERCARLVVVTAPEPAALSDAYALIKITRMEVPALHVDLLVNRTADDAEGRVVFERLETAVRRFLRRELHYLGAIPESAEIRAAVQRPGTLQALRVPAVDAVAHRLVGALT